MKDFINRVKDDFDFYELYKKEPLYFKAFLWFALFVSEIGKAVLFVVAFITIPLWIIPYIIYWCCKNKKEGAENDSK